MNIYDLWGKTNHLGLKISLKGFILHIYTRIHKYKHMNKHQVGEHLERLYNNFIAQNDWNFFVGLGYYIKFIQETRVLIKITNSIKDEGLLVRWKKIYPICELIDLRYPDTKLVIDNSPKLKKSEEAIHILHIIEHQEDLKETSKNINEFKSMCIYIHTYILGKLNSDNVPIEKIKLPTIKSWKDIEIIFQDEWNIKIILRNKEYISDYKELGFADNRSDHKVAKSIKSWSLLQLIASQEGRIDLGAYNEAHKSKIKKQKQEISELLRKAFNFDEDPFRLIDGKFIIRIKLTPDPHFREDYYDVTIKGNRDILPPAQW
jgi:hypothetical protein